MGRPPRPLAAAARGVARGARVLLAALGLVVALARPVDGQSVSPVIAEYDRAGTGRFQVSNPGLFPITVVVEAQGFELDSLGRATFGPLPSDVRLRFSETSFQVPPRGSRTVYYEIEAGRLPTWFTIYSTVVAARSTDRMNVRVQLPHTVYVYGDGLEEEDVEVTDVRYDPAQSRVALTLRNVGDRLGRVGSVKVRDGGDEAEGSGFPLLPRRSRTVFVPWDGDSPPSSVRLELGRFELSLELPRGSAPG